MKPSNPSPNRVFVSLKSSLSQKKVTWPNCVKEGWNLQEDVLSHLLTMTFIARQLGLKVSLKVSGKEY